MRLAVIRDFRDEQWPSMDLCADQLVANLSGISGLTATDLAPPFRRRFTRLPLLGSKNLAFNADRLFNRHFHLARCLRRRVAEFDFFHIVDHSYAHLATVLPAGRTGVYCHDLDAFRSLLEPDKEPRPWWFRRLAKRTLHGLKAARVVFYSTVAIHESLLRYKLVDDARLVHAPYGVAAEFTPVSAKFVDTGVSLDGPFLLHVGSLIPRKRGDVLLEVFAALRQRMPGLRLVQVGGVWPAHLTEQIEELSIGPAIIQMRGLSRDVLAELYRRAAVVLVPSEAEGFGLPVIEALACGAVVVASDIPVLREVGGEAAIFRPVADVPGWVNAILRVLSDPAFAPASDIRLSQAARYSWREHARIIGETYLRIGKS